MLLLVWQHEQPAVGRATGGVGFRGFPFQKATKAAASTKPHSQKAKEDRKRERHTQEDRDDLTPVCDIDMVLY